jgi:hypothetical protein
MFVTLSLNLCIIYFILKIYKEEIKGKGIKLKIRGLNLIIDFLDCK